MINIHSKTGEILVIVVELFKDYIKEIIQALSDNPLTVEGLNGFG